MSIVYVLMNAKKHLPAAPSVDPCSSAGCFTGWSIPLAQAPPSDRDAPVTETPQTWLLRAGWMRHGLIAPSERPRQQL
jgi:putative transposase